MKPCIKNSFFVPLVVAALGSLVTGRATAQTFATLYSFTETDLFDGENSDGAAPVGLILSGSTLYGMAKNGGTGSGTVFKVNTDGIGFRVLHGFSKTSGPYYTNFDGASSWGTVILSGNSLYGTAWEGGNSLGTVFKVNTDGTGFTVLHYFRGGNDGGYHPAAGFVLSSNKLFGTTLDTVFTLNTDGTGFTNLHRFTATSGSSGIYGQGTNNDGTEPTAPLILWGNTLYGTASEGGGGGNGTAFRVNSDGTDFAILHTFSESNTNSLGFSTNGDGAGPNGLVLSNNTLYGTAVRGGKWANGTVFAVNIDGTGFTNLYSFPKFSGYLTNSGASFGMGTNNDGANPYAGLIVSGGTLYGAAFLGGSSGDGTIFALNTDGTGFTTLHDFTAADALFTNSDGANPYSGLILSGNTLYGTANGGGSGGSGTVFSLSFTPQLTISPSVSNIVLSWPTNYAGFDYTGYKLQSTTNLSSPFWTTNLPAPVVVNGQNTVTNPISGTQQFFRLNR
jgi:uncharacterized repeat protein (TIGR03803 family)